MSNVLSELYRELVYSPLSSDSLRSKFYLNNYLLRDNGFNDNGFPEKYHHIAYASFPPPALAARFHLGSRITQLI